MGQRGYLTKIGIRLKSGREISKGTRMVVTWPEPDGTAMYGTLLVKFNCADKDVDAMLLGTTVGKLISGREPTIEELEEYSSNGVCPTPSGVDVEPDGTGPHGEPSWMLLMGVL